MDIFEKCIADIICNGTRLNAFLQCSSWPLFGKLQDKDVKGGRRQDVHSASQHFIGASRQYNMAKKNERNNKRKIKRHPDICAWHNYLNRKFCEIYKKATRLNQWI